MHNNVNQLIEDIRETASGSSRSTVYEYNNMNNMTHKKVGRLEFFYEYSYDEFGNWIEKIETTKVKSRRKVYKRRITY